MRSVLIVFFTLAIFLTVATLIPNYSNAFATTTNVDTILSVSICGNSIVDAPVEECDSPGETGAYSTTILGRQCNISCRFGPYCGDGILQSSYGEECDDGNNESMDFCSAICKVEPAGTGGGSSGGGSGGRGGSSKDLGKTLVGISGTGYPGRVVNILLDGTEIGNISASRTGRFEFTTEATPGTATLGFWSTDDSGVKSIILNSTFDVTQGAITNIFGIVLPPTIKIDKPKIDPGTKVVVSGQSSSEVDIELVFGNNERTEKTTSGVDGKWSITVDTATLKIGTYSLRARSVNGTSTLRSLSNFSTTLQLFVGVDEKIITSADLNRDGKVNLTDFSILIFWWGTAGGNSNPPADINGNKKVGIEDFSILLFNWTG